MRNLYPNGIRAALMLALVMSSATWADRASAETLQQAWEIALAADHGLMAARDNTAAASSMLEAANAARLPHVSVAAGYTTLGNAPTVQAEFLGQSVQLPTAQRSSASYQATAALPLYVGGRIEHGIDAAASALAASRAGELGDMQNLKLRVAEAFADVLRAARGHELAAAHVASLKAHLADVQNLLEQGMVARSDLLAGQLALAEARQKLLQAEQGSDLACSGYNRLLGRALDQPVSLDEPGDEPLPDDHLPALTQRAQATRSELLRMAHEIDALRHQMASVNAEAAPQVMLSGGYGYMQNQYQVHQSQWFASVGMSWAVFDGGIIHQRGNAVFQQVAALTAQRDELVSIITLQVRQAWLAQQEVRARVAVTQSALALADENLRVVRDRYTSGLATHTEVLDAETLRVNAQMNDMNGRYDILIASMRLRRALGGL